MPDGYVCYDPLATASPVGPLPSLTKGHATFGCFNNPAKITPQVVEVWAKILRRLPGARLILKFTGWNDRGVARRFAEMFAAHAIDLGRLELLGHSPHAELLAEYNRIDLALDPFPYNGGFDNLRSPVDGRAGGDLPGRDLRQPAFAQPPFERGSDGNDCPRPGRVRGTGCFFGE
jgi:predicted O-linked N-acetylglucosamine transferase (SPINDLY family)